jgi:hypothetical protein
MKLLKMISNFYSRNKISSVLLLILFCAAMLVANFAIGRYRYFTYTQKIFTNSGLNHSVYFMPAGFGPDAITLPPHEYSKKVDAYHQKIKSFPAVRSVISAPWNGSFTFQNVAGSGYTLYSDELLKAFPLRITSGRSLDVTSNSDPDSNNGIDAVLCGYMYHNIKIGDTFTVKLHPYKSSQYTDVKIHAIGKMDDPAYTVSLGFGGTSVQADELFDKGSVVILRKTQKLLAFLQENSTPQMFENFFVDLKPKSTEKEINDCVQYLNQQGRFVTYDKIKTDTDEAVSRTLKQELPMPFFFLFVSTISLISISILFIYKNLRENSIYYLCGCSRRKSFGYMAAGIGLISLLAGGVNIIIMKNIGSLVWNGFLSVDPMIVDNKSILFIVFYELIVLILSIGIPYTVYRRFSPIETYRRA